ncbi:hypothetical protein RN001_004836 [Aquatica leii]|uniref:Cytochrome P450 n=1 Tax=Aquatica leii TaxID=1421715 RepID=A0AAN7PB79_9COLE|nr:hypothetical protein RN001_004836 [Aquatica leii]
MLIDISRIQDIFAVFVLIILYLLVGYRPPWLWKHEKNQKTIDNIPGPLSLPFLGTRWIYWFGNYSFTKVHEVYADLFRRYGSIVKEETLFNIPVISILDHKDIEKVLKSSGKFPVRPPTEVIAYYRKTRPDRYASGGLVNEQGIVWHHLRTNLTSELTSPRTIASFLPQIDQIIEEWCSLIKQVRVNERQINDLKPLAERLGLEVTCALVLGRRMGFLLPDGISPNAQALANAVHQHFLACRDTFYGLPFWKIWTTPAYMHLVEGEETIYTLALELITSANEEARESAVFQSVLKASVDDREKTAAIVDFIAAGIYTLGNSIVFLLHLIGSNPECQKKLIDDLSVGSTTYLKACINEAFRMIPTAYCLARVSEQDLELSGYHIKAGTVLLCHTGLACKNDSNFTNACKFEPERWIGDAKTSTVSTATFLVTPFGIGKRICPGRRFVEQVLTSLLMNVVEQFNISKEDDLELQFEFILAPKGPVKVFFDDKN